MGTQDYIAFFWVIEHWVFIMLFGLLFGLFLQALAQKPVVCSKGETCTWIEEGKSSIFVIANDGRFGNIMYDYCALMSLQLR